MANVQVREITGTEHVARTFRLRYEVWKDEAELTASVRAQEQITDEHDEHARHWAAFDGDNIVAAACICCHNNQQEIPDSRVFRQMQLPTPVASFNRLVVKKQWRRQGIGNQLDILRIQAGREWNAVCVVVTSPSERIPSLQIRGFKLTELQFTPWFAETLLASGLVLTL